MKHRGMKILAMLLTLAMVVGLMPGMGLTAYAATDTYTQLMNDRTVVQFNNCKWYIIADNSTAVDAGTVTLLAADTRFGTSAFNSTSPYSNAYSSSTLKSKLDALTAEGRPFASVKDAIADTNLNDVGVTGAKLYLLSKREAGPYTNLFFDGAQDGGWWLRSPGRYDTYAAVVIGNPGGVLDHGLPVFNALGVRPALRLNLSKVTFDSNTNTFSLKPAGYSVTLSGGANATTSGGATSQTGLTGAMTTVTYTANSGYTFPAFSNSTTNGVTLTRVSDTVVTVSGTPTANVNITVPDAAAVTANAYTVTYVANNGTDEKAVEDNREEGDYIIQAYDKNFTAPEGKVFDYWQGSDGRKYRDGQTIQLTADLTLKAQWKDEEKPDDGSGKKIEITGDIVFIGGGFGGDDTGWDYVGGGYAPQQAYRVSLAPMQGGSAALGLTTGESSTTAMNVYPTTTVYVFPNAEQGYVLDKIVWSLIDGSASYDITEAKNFVMPAMDVVVYVTFKPVG